jgi:hypothetical protein
VNLYFFRLAKMMAVKEERREGHSYIEPSWMASQICLELAELSMTIGTAYRLGAAVEDSRSVEVLVVFYGVAVLDDAFSAAVGWCDAIAYSIRIWYL